MDTFARTLSDIVKAEEFGCHILGLKGKELDDFANTIVNVELQQKDIVEQSTLYSQNHRNHQYRGNDERNVLRNQILQELFTMKRLSNDKDICLGEGGVLPQSKKIYKQKQAYCVIGLPASGKSGIVNLISEKHGAAIIDSDYAKRKFPEFSRPYGATLTHKESSLIIYGDQNECEGLLPMCVKTKYNIAIPTIGSNKKDILLLSQNLKQSGYMIHLILVRLDRIKSTARAYARYKDEKRYVSLSMIFDQYSNEPTIVYYDLKRENPDTLFSSFTMIDTDIPYGDIPKIIDNDLSSPIDNKDLQKLKKKSSKKVTLRVQS